MGTLISVTSVYVAPLTSNTSVPCPAGYGFFRPLCVVSRAGIALALTPLSLLGIKGEASPLPNTVHTVCLSTQISTAVLIPSTADVL